MTDDIREQVAETMHAQHSSKTWVETPDWIRDSYRNLASAVLKVAEPWVRRVVSEEIAQAIHDRFSHLGPEWHSDMIYVAEWCEGEARRRSHSTQPEEETNR